MPNLEEPYFLHINPNKKWRLLESWITRFGRLIGAAMGSYRNQIALMTLLLSLCAWQSSPSPTDFESLFNQCMTQTAEPYTHAVAELLKKPSIEAYLKKVEQEENRTHAEKRLAHILLCRYEDPDLFHELSEFMKALNKEFADYRPYDRPGPYGGQIKRFLIAGITSKYIEVPDGLKSTGFFKETAYKKVEKYTEEEVTKGKRRNKLVRQAFLEYFLKYSMLCSAFQQREMISVIRNNWRPGRVDLNKNDKTSAEIIESTFIDSERSIHVRLLAGQYLRNFDKKTVVAFMIRFISSEEVDNRGSYNRSVIDALNYINIHADPKTKANVRGMRFVDKWKEEFVDEYISQQPDE